MSIVLRKAKEEDIELLREFESRLVDHERKIEPTIKQVGHIEYYDIPALITSNKAVILIAEKDGRPVGCGLGNL